MLLDLRLNIMNKYVDKFIITEATYMHNGSKKKLNFDINKFSKFKDKITYIVVDKPPPELLNIYEKDNKEKKESKKIWNAYKREICQIEKTKEGILDASSEDMIIVSDLDEIPNLKKINLNTVKEKLIFFKQKMYYYKLNLLYKSLPWYGSKACKKKYFHTPQWLRTIKNKKYPIWRLDTVFSKNKYGDILFVENGGWHFTNIRKAEDLEKKLLGFLHHVDYENSGLKLDDLKIMMKEKRVMYNHSLDKKVDKWGKGEKLITTKIDEMPDYVLENLEKYKPWLDI
jgi:beta-1,4-mannosyl-glycoprotein beta-1,4-N-acetylglucosaminyltransferase